MSGTELSSDWPRSAGPAPCALRNSWWRHKPGALRGLEGANPLPKFWARAKVLDDGRWIHPYYRFLYAVSHGEGSLVEEYLEEADSDHAWGHRFLFRDPE